MKSLMKKGTVFLLVLLAVLGVSMSAYAQGGGITVHGSELEGKDVTAIRMFGLVTSVSGNSTNYAYTLEDAWADFFTQAASDKYSCSGKEGQALSDAAYDYVSKLNNAAVVDFAKEALTWAKGKSVGTPNPLEALSVTATGDANDTATFTGVEDGYYLVFPEAGSTSNDRHTEAMLLNVAGEVVTQELKSEYPTVDKQIQGAGNAGVEAADAKIGDTITFTLTSKVPDMADYSSYTFKFIDTLSAGLTFGEVLSVTVDGAAAAYAEPTSAPNTSDSTKSDVTIELTDFYNNYNTKVGAPIVVKYTAILNENAVVGINGNTNSAIVEYSNDPSNITSTGTSTPDEVKTYTFDFTMDKYTGDTYDAAAARLPGAVFELKAAKADNSGPEAAAIQMILVDDGDGSAADGDKGAATAVYRIAKAGEAGKTEMITPNSGKIMIEGLAAGTYYLEEITPPTGYNKLADPVKIDIKAVYDATTHIPEVTVTYGTTTASDGIVPIQNKTGALLPTTGGIGTLLTTVCGVVLVIGGAAWIFIMKKRKDRA